MSCLYSMKLLNKSAVYEMTASYSSGFKLKLIAQSLKVRLALYLVKIVLQ